MTHPPVPFDPELAAALTVVQEQISAVISLEDLPAIREAGAARWDAVTESQLTLDGSYEVTDRSVPGPSGAPDIMLTICLPRNATTPTAAIYHTHGGGMIMGDRKGGLPDILELADRYGAAVISVEYRLAPETKHPGPIEDVYAGLVWTAAHAADLNLDPDRIVIAGGSAGGGLTAALALLARDRGGPAIRAQLLICPMLDDRNDTVSSGQMAGRGVWDREANRTGWSALLGDAVGGPDVSPYAAPARATDLSGLPPAFIDVGSAETFRDEDVAYATAIWHAGGEAELHVWPGGFHGFDMLAPTAAVSRDAKAARHRWLDRILG